MRHYFNYLLINTFKDYSLKIEFEPKKWLIKTFYISDNRIEVN